MQNATSAVKEIIIELQSGPVSYEIDETGYGFAVERCDDQSSIIQINGQTGNPMSLTEISKIILPTEFEKLYVTNYEAIVPGTIELIKLLIIKDPSLQLSTIAPYRAIADAMTFAQLFILQASGSTTRYTLWSVDAALSTPSIYTDPNQEFFSTIPLIQYIQPLSIVSGSAFTLSTTSIPNLISLTQYPQDPIPSKFISEKATLPFMGYSVIYTPSVTASGTSIFLLGIQQPLSVQQLNLAYSLTE